jgi:hypothetical protein
LVAQLEKRTHKILLLNELGAECKFATFGFLAMLLDRKEPGHAAVRHQLDFAPGEQARSDRGYPGGRLLAHNGRGVADQIKGRLFNEGGPVLQTIPLCPAGFTS